MNRLSTIPSRALTDNRLNDSERVTLGMIASYGNKSSDGWSYPSYRTIAEERGFTRRTAIRHVKKLYRLGYLNRVVRERENGSHSSNMYQVRYDFEPEGGGGDIDLSLGGDTECHQVVTSECHSHKDKTSKLEAGDLEARSSLSAPDKSAPKNEGGQSSLFGTGDGESPAGDQKQPKRNRRQRALHELETLFCHLTKLKPPPRSTKKQRKAAAARWWGPLGTIYTHLAEEDLEQAKRILTIATTRMKNDNLTISAPQSVEQVANHVYAELASKPESKAERVGDGFQF